MRDRRVLVLLTGAFLVASQAGCQDLPDSNSGADVAPALRGDVLAVEVLPHPDADATKGYRTVIIRFRNTGSAPVWILKPLDGSRYCWLMPYYRFTVRDADGRPLARKGRCGNFGLWANMQWPQDYLVEIKPGASFQMESWLPHEVKRYGPHTVSFEYVYEPAEKAFPAPPPRAWRGSVKAPDIVLHLRR